MKKGKRKKTVTSFKQTNTSKIMLFSMILTAMSASIVYAADTPTWPMNLKYHIPSR